jgi:putative SOS response-associated peptidase YedK
LPDSLKQALTSNLIDALRRAASTVAATIRPTDPSVIINGPSDGPSVDVGTWGLIPRWAKDATIARHTFNARCETLSEKPAFREAFRSRRCLVPASSWVEWIGPPGKRMPIALIPPGGLGAFAGLWESWRGADGTPRQTFTIVTCPPVPGIADVHDRMPLILPPADWSGWLAAQPDQTIPAPWDVEYQRQPLTR